MSMNETTKRTVIKAIEELQSLALAQIERMPDHAERIHATFLQAGRAGVAFELEKIASAQKQTFADAIRHGIVPTSHADKQQSLGFNLPDLDPQP